MLSVDEQIRIIGKGAAEIINLDDLRAKLTAAQKTGRPLSVKLGLDPTAPDIHLGHTVVLRKIRQFQDLGHKSVIVIGDFTGMMGDPTGKSATRKQLSRKEVLDNARTYEGQIYKVLDKDKTEIRFNSEWLAKLNFADVISLCAETTVARMLEREDFKQRFAAQESIGVHEFMYPLMQGYDSVALQTDIELGGTEQRYNILMGRTLQKAYGQEAQVALFMPILEGTDGVNKMSKSLGNYIGIDESPKEMYGKVMSLPDQLITRYFELATDIHPHELEEICQALARGINPRDIKMRLAREITALYHGSENARLAEQQFRAVFQRRELPEDISGFWVPEVLKEADGIELSRLLHAADLCSSTSEARRLIQQGAVKINGIRILALKLTDLKNGDVIQAGKRRFIRILL